MLPIFLFSILQFSLDHPYLCVLRGAARVGGAGVGSQSLRCYCLLPCVCLYACVNDYTSDSAAELRRTISALRLTPRRLSGGKNSVPIRGFEPSTVSNSGVRIEIRPPRRLLAPSSKHKIWSMLSCKMLNRKRLSLKTCLINLIIIKKCWSNFSAMGRSKRSKKLSDGWLFSIL